MSEKQPIVMMICEVPHLMLRPDTPYVFKVDPSCKACVGAAAPYAEQQAPASAPPKKFEDWTDAELYEWACEHTFQGGPLDTLLDRFRLYSQTIGHTS